jgi:hypothetical protein
MVRKSNKLQQLKPDKGLCKVFNDILKEHHKMVNGLEYFELKHELNRIADLDMMMKIEHELKQCMIAILISFRYHYIIDRGIQNLSFTELKFYVDNFIQPNPVYKNDFIPIINIKYDPDNDYRYVYNPELIGEDRYKLINKYYNKLTDYEIMKYTTMIYNKYNINI